MSMTSLFNMPDFKEISFDRFYKIYPRKVGKHLAQKCFQKLSKKDKLLAYNGLNSYIEFWKISDTEKQFIPHPSSFINQKRWEDEVELPKPKEIFKLDATGNSYVGYCSKCRVSDFFNKWELQNTDSRCCKAKIVPVREQ